MVPQHPKEESMSRFGRSGLLVGALTVAACAQQAPAPPPPTPAPDTRAADEAAIHALVKDWSAAAQAKDVEKFLSVYADDAAVMMEAAPDVSGKAAIREAIGGMMGDPNFALSFAADKVVVARAGDLAYETGSYTMTMSDPKKKPATQAGHYVVVWQKQADGSWKVVIDAPISDPPAAAAK
jgi:uncharacterized protein (TIGR02246 family)